MQVSSASLSKPDWEQIASRVKDEPGYEKLLSQQPAAVHFKAQFGLSDASVKCEPQQARLGANRYQPAV